MKIIDCNGKDFQEICKEVRESEVIVKKHDK